MGKTASSTERLNVSPEAGHEHVRFSLNELRTRPTSMGGETVSIALAPLIVSLLSCLINVMRTVQVESKSMDYFCGSEFNELIVSVCSLLLDFVVFLPMDLTYVLINLIDLYHGFFSTSQKGSEKGCTDKFIILAGFSVALHCTDGACVARVCPTEYCST